SSPNRSMMNCPTSVVDVGSVCVAHARNSSIWSGDSRPVPPFRSNRTSASTPPSWNSLSQMRMVESSMNSASATAAKDQPRSSSRTAFARRETRFSSSPSLAIATRSTRSAALRQLRFVFTRRLESIPVIRSNDFRKGEESRSTQNCRAKPLLSYRVIVELIGATTTQTGLTVRCELDDKIYPKGILVSDEQMQTLNISRDDFHGEWNYTIAPSVASLVNAVDSLQALT